MPDLARLSTEPRRHRNADFLAAKRKRLHEPHISALNDYVDRIRHETGLDVPYLDPDFGGIKARVLFVLEAPARAAAHGSGMLSADNDDGTAANMWRAYAETGLPRPYGLHWNAVPWYVGTNEKLGTITAQQIRDGQGWTLELVKLLPELRVVVALGAAARKAIAPIRADLDAQGLTVLDSPHPSQRRYNATRGAAKLEVHGMFIEALKVARS